ncbi:phosphopantetheine-binding protein (plasmid) [Alkalihalophilus pseudofirmus]|uniref:phosphopantetheine-binding protein n=1 Tax=Alkalihalophilus pseudofirmus TaxID=79885 RepID=UPI00259BC8BB|nr:phosphopantetheine-binding protein [Alkalihalophilus pseudofirmus]WEG19163.1 phosphopantetheine-binding protein [Alkalihalophilus pseudofirmus]
MESNVKLKVKEFLSKYFRNHQLEDEEDIFSLGFVNSLFAMQLVMFLEKEFNLKLDNNDLNFNNFRSINKITSLVEEKMVQAT